MFQGESVADNTSLVHAQLFFVARQFMISFMLNKYFKETPKDRNVVLLCRAVTLNVVKRLEANGRKFSTQVAQVARTSNGKKVARTLVSMRQPGDAPIPPPFKKVKFTQENALGVLPDESRKLKVENMKLALQLSELAQANDDLKKQIEELIKHNQNKDP